MLQKNDKIIVLSSAVLCIFFAYKFLTFDSSLTSNTDSEKIAVVSNLTSSVKRKNEGSLNWAKLKSQEDIYNGDQVFTDTSSEVTIVFDDSSSIDIPQNTLIKIEKRESNIEIDLQKGLVDLDLSKFKKSKVFFKIGKKVVTFNKSDSIVKIQNNDNVIKLSSSKGDVIVTEVADKTKLPTNNSITIKKDQNIEFSNSEDKKWKRELSKVGKRVDRRLVESQVKKIEIILKDELVKKSNNEKTYNTLTENLYSKSIELDISPKEIILTELSILKKESSRPSTLGRSTKRIRTIRDLQTLQSSVIKYIDSRFGGDEVLVQIAKEKVSLARRDKAIVSNEQLMAKIGEDFDSLGVKDERRSIGQMQLRSVIADFGQQMNRKLAFRQYQEINRVSGDSAIKKLSMQSMSKVYADGKGSSPLNEVQRIDNSFSEILNSKQRSKEVNKEIIQKLGPILKTRVSATDLKAIKKDIQRTTFSQKGLSVEEQLLSLDSIKKVLSTSPKKGWTVALKPISSEVSKISPQTTAIVEPKELVLSSIKREFLLSEISEISPIKKALEEIDLTETSSSNKVFQKAAKSLDDLGVSLPIRADKDSWTSKLAKIGEDKDLEYSKLQLEQLESYAPEISKVIKVDKHILVNTPKEIVKKKLVSRTNVFSTQQTRDLKKAVSLTNDIEVNKQELFETIQAELGLTVDGEATKVVQQHLQESTFSGNKLELRDSLTSLGKKLDKLGINRPFLKVPKGPSFLNKEITISSPLIKKPLSNSVVAGQRESIIISKSAHDKGNYELEFSKSKDFKEISYAKRIENKVGNISFSKSGDYYYRVSKTASTSEADSFRIKHTDAPKIYSKVKKISVVAPAAPTLKPTSTGLVEMSKFSSFPIEWTGPKSAIYEVEVSQKGSSPDKAITSRVFKVSGNGTKLDLSKMNVKLDPVASTITPEDLSYRVRIASPAISAWSEPMSPKVSVEAAVIPKQEKSLQVKRRFQKKAKLNFEWNSTLPDQEHTLSVARDREFKSLIVKKDVRGNSATVSSTYEGPLFWKVVPKRLASAQAPVLQREVLSSTIRIDKKVVKKVIPKSVNSPVTKVDLGWRYTRKTKTAQKKVELATDPQFKNIIDEKVLDTSVLKTQFDLKSNGQYYWRVKDIGKGAANISGVNSFEVVTGVDLPVPKVLAKQIIHFRVVNDLPAYEIILPKTDQAVMIELEVYSDEDLSKLIFKKKFKNSKALWVTNRSGKFYYRARGIDKIGRYSKFSKPGKLIFPISPLINSDLE
ncbi:FecR domain-containing protein [Halobacteriovorax sp. HLS]|uniref:FecR domain-containing protein n=1 Tax=Halobacteriovorax sp. HLS TaxID=2234000 RepID=UPI000FD89633|nr:FecR domain-containing protein [Halobacteriovorax sp. HLS]